jgi:CheY-like chemotaxis protein
MQIAALKHTAPHLRLIPPHMSQDDHETHDTDAAPPMSEADRDAETSPFASERPVRDTQPPDEADFEAERVLKTMLPPHAPTLEQDTDTMTAMANDELLAVHREVMGGIRQLLDPGGRLDLQTKAIASVVDQAVARLEQATEKIDGNHQLLAGQLQSLSKASAEKDAEHDRRFTQVFAELERFRTRLEAIESKYKGAPEIGELRNEFKSMAQELLLRLELRFGAPGPAALKGRIVLVTEDEETLLRVLQRTIEGRGATVLPARNFDEVRQTLASARADFVLLDLRLKGESGFEIAEWLLKTEQVPRGRILLITGDVTPEDRKAAERLGLAMTSKPIDSSDLIDTILMSLATPTA